MTIVAILCVRSAQQMTLFIVLCVRSAWQDKEGKRSPFFSDFFSCVFYETHHNHQHYDSDGECGNDTYRLKVVH